MDNQIILYNKQTVDCLIYSASSLTEAEQTNFKDSEALTWEEYNNAKIICNFEDSLTSSYLDNIDGAITGYEVSKKRPQENFLKKIGVFSSSELPTEDDKFYYIIDYNIKNNNEYAYFVSPITDEYIQATLSSKIITQWDVFTLSPIIQIKDNQYKIVLDECGYPIIWSFHLNCSEGDITLTQDKTIFTSFASKPKIFVGDLNYHSGSFSCLLGNCLYNDQYYEPNILLEKWETMIKKNQIYLFKNVKGDSMIITLEDGIKKKYMNEAANYYLDTYNKNTAITNRPTTIDFSYIEIKDSEEIQIYGCLNNGIL